jgi:hypothetical protein
VTQISTEVQVPKSVEQALQGKRAKIAKRPLEKTPAIPAESTERRLQGKGAATSSVTAGISTNDFYDPTILQDYGGEVFRHENASLRQLDFRDVDNELIYLNDWYSALRRGTLVLARATLHAYNWEGRRVRISICAVGEPDVRAMHKYPGVSTQCADDQSPQAIDSAGGTGS